MSAADVPDPGLRTRVCESCGEEFGCGALTAACWCGSVDVAPPAREVLAERFGDCLCPACLNAAAGGLGRRPRRGEGP